MIPSWMIDELERRRREREEQGRQQLWIELPMNDDRERSPRTPPSRQRGEPIVIEL
jgi:hypothetical protein